MATGFIQRFKGRIAASVIYLSGFFYESTTDGIVAHAGGGQTLATQLTAEMNRIATVATAGDSVRLPASASGLTIIVENAGANPAQVFGYSTDTINGVATATGVTQMASSIVIYTCYTAGAWFAANLGTGYSGSLETQSYSTGIVAAGTTQATATALSTMVSNVTTAAASSGVILPSASPGATLTVANNGANSLSVYPPVGATMNGTLNAAAALATATVGLYFCIAPNVWISK